MTGAPVRYRLCPAHGAEERGEGVLALGSAELTVTAPASAPLRFPYRDLTAVEEGDHLLRLRFAGGDLLELSHLGKRFEEVARALTALRRTHLDGALLLEEGGQGEEDRGVVRRRAPGGALGPERTAALRPQRTSLAVLCEGEQPFLVPYGTVRDVTFDAQAHAVVLSLWDGGAVELAKLGKRTDAVRRALLDRLGALAGRSAAALASLVPSATPLQVRALAAAVRDGVPASRQAVEAAVPGAWEAIWGRSFAGGRQPYAEALAARASGRWLCVKELAGEPGAAEAAGGEEPGATLPPECRGRRLLYLLDLGAAIAAEAPGSEDVATYLFRAGADPRGRVEAVCRAFAAVQFRREPIHLAETALQAGEHARYREVVALVPELREARAAFLGRALHTSLEAWAAGLDEALAR
ncbi:MAG: hypothetical protein HZB56_10025 [Deltaproteobacteria bacterium]|nr:hypothetical protein [Deltaproteobacteria bacterium]